VNFVRSKALGGIASGPDAIRYACDEFVFEGDSQERSRAPVACEVYRGAHRTCDVRHPRDVARLGRMRKLFDVLEGRVCRLRALLGLAKLVRLTVRATLLMCSPVIPASPVRLVG